MKKLYIVSLACLLVGVGIGYFLGFSYERKVLFNKLDELHPIRESNSAYKFIDPLLAYVIPSADHNTRLLSIKDKIEKLIDSEKNNGLMKASVFLSDLNRGRWIGVNENEQYNPASTLKVVIMVVYLKDAESNPSILNKNLVYTEELSSILKSNQFNSESELKVEKSYSVDYLINKMIIDSDNGAELLLLDNINNNSLKYIYSALNIKNPEDFPDNFLISPRTYSLFVRIIYSSTYLSKDMSEKAMEILSKTTFKEGIVAGVPEGTVVAHKFGQFLSTTNTADGVELHDCGIIYYPDYPYLLCVMTKGNSLDELKNVIKGISKITYENY